MALSWAVGLTENDGELRTLHLIYAYSFKRRLSSCALEFRRCARVCMHIGVYTMQLVERDSAVVAAEPERYAARPRCRTHDSGFMV